MHRSQMRKAPARLAVVIALALGGGVPAHGGPAGDARPAAWANDFTARLEALALLQTLNAELLSHDSATLTLDRWCDAHHLASPAKVVAVRDRDAGKPATAELRRALGVGDTEPIRYRRVKLACGGHVLSEADNWYVPSRLTPEMNRQLDATDVAFGRAVQALHFQRRTLSARLLWSPLPDGWDVAQAALPDAGAKALAIPHAVLEHRAVLTLPDATPFSLVVETYTEQVLAFPQPRPPR
jgi:chorismate-pyruvate lyase